MRLRNRFVSLAAILAVPAMALAGPGPKQLTDAQVDAALLRLYETDRPYRVDIQPKQVQNPGGARLFDDLPAGVQLHPSFQATYDLCKLHDAYNKVDTEVPEAAIDSYMALIEDMAPVQEALFLTGTTIKDLKNSWFRGGRGFEHVICGESGPGREAEPAPMAASLAGFHFWYMHYRYEREGKAVYQGADFGGADDPAGMADPRIVSGKMSVDFDAAGPKKPLAKDPRGGFIVGNSAAVILAAGHIVFRGASAAHQEQKFLANLNGKVYSWTFHTVDWEGRKSIRTFWPRFIPDALAAESSYATE